MIKEITINTEINFLQKIVNYFIKQSHIIRVGESHHYKGLKNDKFHNKKEVGDYLVFVEENNMSKYGSMLSTYQIIGVDENKVKLELLEFNVNR